MRCTFIQAAALAFLAAAFPCFSNGQSIQRELKFAPGGTIEVKNHYGRIEAAVAKPATDEQTETIENSDAAGIVLIKAWSSESLNDADIKIEESGNAIRVEVDPKQSGKRVDVQIRLPARSRFRANTLSGEVTVSGNLELIELRTETGTIAVDVPTESLTYDLQWNASRPRILSAFEIESAKERSGGRFSIKGQTVPESAENEKNGSTADERPDDRNSLGSAGSKTRERSSDNILAVRLKISTDRGIVLLNVPPNEVSSDLRERPLT
ncbi:MAG: hypothetical protein WBD22_05310, partial [Pyrinomonadaceae bacterium]